MLTILEGDCLSKLPEIADASVQMCATSPPYFGLRDYGTSTWDGGDPACDHRPDPEEVRRAVMAKSTINVGVNGDDSKQMDAASARMMKSPCPKCGAVRVDKQIGSEETPEEYIASLVAVFREVRRTLTDDGTLFLNLGDSYANDTKWGGASGGKHVDALHGDTGIGRGKKDTGLKAKDLMMIPARVAIALQSDGWYLRSQIPWVKRQAMPESVEDRPNSAVEYVFLLSKNPTYYYDHVAVKMPAQSGPSDIRKMMEQKDRIGGKHLIDDPGPLAAHNPATNIGKNEESGDRTKVGFNARWNESERNGHGGKNAFRGHGHFREGDGPANREGRDMTDVGTGMVRNWRNSDSFIDTLRGLLENESGDPLAFLVNSQPYREAHFATWPPKLVQPMILAGSRPGDTVLDPFFGSGTTGMVALSAGRRCIGIELNPKYVKLARTRCETTVGLGL